MKILIVNPNTSREATRFIEQEARHSAANGTTIISATAPRGPLNISSAEDSRAQGPVVLEVLKEARDIDGAIVAAYSDPGLDLALDELDLPIVGIGESSMKEAARLGERIAIISTNPNNEPIYRDCADRAGLSSRLASIRYLPKAERSVLDVLADREWIVSTATREARAVLETNEADVIIVAGGPLAGVARDVAPSLSLPVLDCVTCAVHRVERWIRRGSPN